jgi:hypothetical protein
MKDFAHSGQCFALSRRGETLRGYARAVLWKEQ